LFRMATMLKEQSDANGNKDERPVVRKPHVRQQVIRQEEKSENNQHHTPDDPPLLPAW
jgi:hypothetical protein